MEKIDKLTPEQEASMADYVTKYTAIGLSTKPIDFDLAKKTMEKFLGTDADGYEFVFVGSPKGIPESASVITYGAHDVHWVAYYSFFNDHFGICPEIEDMSDVVQNCSWVYYSEVEKNIYISDAPREIHMDDQGRLHNEFGPSVLYSDGFSVYSWHGNRVPKSWIMDKDSLGPDEFLKHSNIELRRVAAEIVGWAAVLNSMDYVVIDEDGDPEIGSLLEVDIPEIGKEKFLKVMCGTKREFAIPVPPEAKTALEAQAMLFGLTVEEFQIPEIRT
jgi:hypothetical protein